MNVFFWDSPRLEYEASRDCDLVISGETFGRSGYGIALQKNSFWTERVTLQLLRLIESGFMETLDNKWILRTDKRCDKYLESSFPTTLGLENMAGVFILVGTGRRHPIGFLIFRKPNLKAILAPRYSGVLCLHFHRDHLQETTIESTEGSDQR